LKVLVTGAQGLVGSEVSDYCTSIGDTVLGYDHAGLDITNRERVRQTLINNTPDAVINCAAWTDVDGCESDKERAYAVNADGPENLAAASRDSNAAFVTISTDYVFDGRKDGFYTESDTPNPQSIYAASKLAGEIQARKVNPQTVVVRTGFVFGPRGNNFLSTVIDRARRGDRLTVIGDAYGTPTYSKDLAIRLRELAERNVAGIYHAVNGGPGVSFEEFTRAALALSGCESVDVVAVSMESLGRPAKRPRNSRLRSINSSALGLPSLRDWHEALTDFVSHC